MLEPFSDIFMNTNSVTSSKIILIYVFILLSYQSITGGRSNVTMMSVFSVISVSFLTPLLGYYGTAQDMDEFYRNSNTSSIWPSATNYVSMTGYLIAPHVICFIVSGLSTMENYSSRSKPKKKQHLPASRILFILNYIIQLHK